MDPLVYEFHGAGMWTPEEIRETVQRSPLVQRFEILPRSQKERDVVIRAIMADRYEQERRGMWGRVW